MRGGFRGNSGGRSGFSGGRNNFSGGRSGGRERYSNPCLTMHQPWASLLIHGIKRVEGRSWPSPITGRLWIHAASKVPDPETIKAMEEFYREIYAVNGITDIKFPEHYPVSRLLGCVEVVGCVKCEELVCWEAVPESVRLEGLTDFCWLCENPQKLIVPFEMRGFQGVYNLERRIYESAVRGLCKVQGPLPVEFPLPNPQDRLSLKPGSLASYFTNSEASLVEKAPSVSAAIAGARAAANQFSKKDQINASSSYAVGSKDVESDQINASPVEKEPSVSAVIASVRPAATQFSKENQLNASSRHKDGLKDVESIHHTQTAETDVHSFSSKDGKVEQDHHNNTIQKISGDGTELRIDQQEGSSRNLRTKLGASSKLFAAALNGITGVGRTN